MTKREMAKALDEAKSVLVALQDFVLAKAVRDAANTLLREAEREEQERPKVTLAQMVEACSYASGLACGPHVEWLDLAADTLRKLDEEGGKLLAEARPGERHTIDSLGGWMCSAINLLSSLGVKEKP